MEDTFGPIGMVAQSAATYICGRTDSSNCNFGTNLRPPLIIEQTFTATLIWGQTQNSPFKSNQMNSLKKIKSAKFFIVLKFFPNESLLLLLKPP